MNNKSSNSTLTSDLLVASTPTPKANRAQSSEHHLIPFHAALHQDLRSASLTQRDVAKILGVSQQSVSKWRKNTVFCRPASPLRTQTGSWMVTISGRQDQRAF